MLTFIFNLKENNKKIHFKSINKLPNFIINKPIEPEICISDAPVYEPQDCSTEKSTCPKLCSLKSKKNLKRL